MPYEIGSARLASGPAQQGYQQQDKNSSTNYPYHGIGEKSGTVSGFFHIDIDVGAAAVALCGYHEPADSREQ